VTAALQALTDRCTALVMAARDLERDCRTREVALLPPGTDCAGLIAELVAAEDMADENFTRWPRENLEPDDPRHPYQPGSECHAHWSAACARKDAAVLALSRYGRAVAK
jgi:hypothetical protein